MQLAPFRLGYHKKESASRLCVTCPQVSLSRSNYMRPCAF
jgi:hypothetical protein